MGRFLSSILKAPVCIRFLRLVRDLEFSALRKQASNQGVGHSFQPGCKALNCRIRLTSQQEKESFCEVFTVEICGSIRAPSDMHCATVQILITDVTDGVYQASPVHSCVKQWQKEDCPTFCYTADIGTIPDADTTISEWMPIARLHLNWLTFPRKGKRDLQFTALVLSAENREELARATRTIAYENSEFGYMDLEKNIRQAKTLAVALAFAVSAADRKLYNCEIELIKNWARTNVDFLGASNKAKRRLEKALNRTVRFFRDGNQPDVYRICKEIVELAPIALRYDILDLCLRVAQANGVAGAEELGLLKNLANWLEADMDRFREMMGKILPVKMHQVKDLEFILGVEPDMSEKQARERLNKEYRKWNARVTNSDAEIRRQADNMLEFIAKARSECVA